MCGLYAEVHLIVLVLSQRLRQWVSERGFQTYIVDVLSLEGVIASFWVSTC